jgi:hypothetical protein
MSKRQPKEERPPTEEEIDAALWDAYKYLIALGKRRIARQAAEAAQAPTDQAGDAGGQGGEH